MFKMFKNTIGHLQHFNQLTKIKLSTLNSLVCSLSFLFVSPNPIFMLPLAKLFFSCQFLAMSSQVLNQLLEVQQDRKMERTNQRPLVKNIISQETALVLGIGLFSMGNILASNLSQATSLTGTFIWFSYLTIYTPMKKKSQFNTILGAAIGAGPVVMGAMASQILQFSNLNLFVLSFYMFAWQIQHFYGIRFIYQKDYNVNISNQNTFEMIQSKQQASFISFYVNWLALISINMSMVYWDCNIFYLLNILISYVLYKYGMRASINYSKQKNGNKLKSNSYIHFTCVFICIIIQVMFKEYKEELLTI